MHTQLVAAKTVAQALADLTIHAAGTADGEPVSEIAGPRAENLVDVAIQLAARRGGALRIEGVSDPTDPDRALYESGGLLPGPRAILAGPTFEQWLNSTQ
jgi:hypothetical protein